MSSWNEANSMEVPAIVTKSTARLDPRLVTENEAVDEERNILLASFRIYFE